MNAFYNEIKVTSRDYLELIISKVESGRCHELNCREATTYIYNGER